MFKLLGIREILTDLVKLTRNYFEGAPNKQNLQFAYKNFLRNAQPDVPKSLDNEISLLWKKEEIGPYLGAFQEDSILNDFDEVFDESLRQVNLPVQMIKDALLEMHKTNKEFACLLELVIHTIFYAPSKLAGGGSTSAAIGCIWMDLRAHWQLNDVLEFLVHETTHNLVFIDELCFTHYSSYPEIAKKENFACSAILNKLRPIDKVFHSILVSTEVLLFRRDHFGHPEKPCLHPPTSIMLEQTKRSIESVFDNPKIEILLTDRAKLLLKKCNEKIDSVKLEQLCAK